MDKELIIAKKYIVTDQNIDDLMITALEGGINYWCEKVVINQPEKFAGKFASDIISLEGSLTLFDSEMDTSYILTKDKFMKGLEMILGEQQFEGDFEEFMDDHDADTADIIIQYALFGEQVYC